MQLGSEFVCDRRLKLFGFISTPWVCGGIMRPAQGDHSKLICEACGHTKDFQAPVHIMNSRTRWETVGMLVAALVSAGAYAAPPQKANCDAQVPYGAPVLVQAGDHQVKTLEVCRTAYLVMTDRDAKIPVWVAYTLTPDHAIGCAERSNAFTADDSIPADNRAKPSDYVGSGYDIGHTAPDGDMRWDPEVERESFILTNMSPQLPGLNRGLWKLLETAVRAGAYENGHTYLVYAGPVYDITSDKKIGDDQVDVPTGFYKIVVDTVTGHYTAFSFPQAENLGNNLELVRTTLARIEEKTGYRFPLPVNAVEAPIWPYNFKKLTSDTKAKCPK